MSDDVDLSPVLYKLDGVLALVLRRLLPHEHAAVPAGVFDLCLASSFWSANNMLLLDEPVLDLLLWASALHPLVVDDNVVAVGQAGFHVLRLHVVRRRFSDYDLHGARGAVQGDLGLGVRQPERHVALEQGLGLLGQLAPELPGDAELHVHVAVGLWVQRLLPEVLGHLDPKVLCVRGAKVCHLLPQCLRDLGQVLAEQLGLPFALVDLPLGVVYEERAALVRAFALVLVEVLVCISTAVLQAVRAEAALAASAADGTAVVVIQEGLPAARALQREDVVYDLETVLVELELLFAAGGGRQLRLQLLDLVLVLLLHLLLDALLGHLDSDLQVVVEDFLRDEGHDGTVAEGRVRVFHRAQGSALALLLVGVFGRLERL
mmetsp:Transcript_71241/g.159492  ORF Transcript_71241/g.159492 Transcript_71241/m.159492 type:complete len:376 (-) Transcript_71241:100-1227(-)